jgi:hypothetical protein
MGLERMLLGTEMVRQPTYWRLRKGDWWANYCFDDNKMIVTGIQKRSWAYR